jgi:hypothetical protein
MKVSTPFFSRGRMLTTALKKEDCDSSYACPSARTRKFSAVPAAETTFLPLAAYDADVFAMPLSMPSFSSLGVAAISLAFVALLHEYCLSRRPVAVQGLGFQPAFATLYAD